MALKQEIYQPLENYRVGRNEITAGTVSPSYMLPLAGLQRLEKIMDEYCGGCGQRYMVNTPLMERGIELLKMLREDLANLGADGLHQLLRAWELHHRVLASECVMAHTMYREETRWPGTNTVEISRSLTIRTGIALPCPNMMKSRVNSIWRKLLFIILWTNTKKPPNK